MARGVGSERPQCAKAVIYCNINQRILLESSYVNNVDAVRVRFYFE